MEDPAGKANAGKYYILTWGCQMNLHDSEKLAGSLRDQGYLPAERASQADVILLNTCSIREKASEKVFSELGRLRELKAKRPGLVLGVCGCVAQQEGSRILERAPFVDLVLGTRATASLPMAIERAHAGDSGAMVDTEIRDDSIRFPFDRIRREGVGTRKAFVTVIEGCNHRCTFCIVPTTRGREVCRESDDVLEEVRALAASGVAEVEFLGQTVNAYRDSGGRTLADLLRGAAKVPGIRRLRFTTSHPAQMTDTLMDAMAGSGAGRGSLPASSGAVWGQRGPARDEARLRSRRVPAEGGGSATAPAGDLPGHRHDRRVSDGDRAGLPRVLVSVG